MEGFTSRKGRVCTTTILALYLQKLGCRHGKVVRGMRKARVIALTKEVETLKCKIAAQEVARDAWEAQFSAQDEKMSMILRALQMSGLQISMPAPNLAPPLTSQPLQRWSKNRCWHRDLEAGHL
ncbi:hypothetical protein PS1_030612 [Malus domestica]